MTALDPVYHRQRRVKNLNLSTVAADDHPLSITDANGVTASYRLTGSQVQMLMHQAGMAFWTYYRMVPRDDIAGYAKLGSEACDA